MEETFNDKVFILASKPFSESGSKISVYSENFGKLELIARGTKKIKSKLAGHIEPINMARAMIVKGRRCDYIGAAAAENCYARIKSDFSKTKAAGEAIGIFNSAVKAGGGDSELFRLLEDYFDFLDCAADRPDYDFFVKLFVFKLLALSGHCPELRDCVNCGHKIARPGNKFNFAKGGLVCAQCSDEPATVLLPLISENAIKILRMARQSGFKKLNKIIMSVAARKEVINIISLFFDYYF